MPTACIQTPGARVSLESERLVVVIPDEDGVSLREIRRDIPLRDLERMVMGERVSATTPALMEMLRRHIPISFIDSSGRFLGSFQPAAPDHGAARLRHYQRALDPDFALTIARNLIAAKIHNQRRIVQRVAANRRAEEREIPPGIPYAIDQLDRSLHRAAVAASLDSLRGHEGAAAARYFSAWATLLPPDFPFERRSTRPPLNPVNACLSFSSTLVYQETHAYLHAHGLDAALGLLHTTENGRWSLALDLMEPFRPVIAEALTLDLFSHRMLNASHFQPHDGGIWLNREGRSKLILQYEKRMDRQFLSEHTGHRTTLRQQLENHAIRFKSALDDPAAFSAFRMN
jgi:CRISP-associated protein Cas1